MYSQPCLVCILQTDRCRNALHQYTRIRWVPSCFRGTRREAQDSWWV